MKFQIGNAIFDIKGNNKISDIQKLEIRDKCRMIKDMIFHGLIIVTGAMFLIAIVN